jgi:hypothetical protein
MTFRTLSRLSALALPVMIQSAAAGETKGGIRTGGDWEYSISVGPTYRQIGTIRTNSGSNSGGLTLPSLVGGDSLTTPAIGELPFADRQYDNGYVNQDAGTPSDGDTWNWGYASEAQIVPSLDPGVDRQLVFNATGFQSTYSEIRNAPLRGPSSRDDLDGIAPRLQFDARSPRRLGAFRLGFTAGIDFVSTDQSRHFSNFSLMQTRSDFRLDYADRYNLPNDFIVPQAPYQGSFFGPGPLLGNTPDQRAVDSVPIGSQSATFSNHVSSSVDISSLTLNFGPTLSARRGRYDFSVSGGFTLNVYDWKAKQSETLLVNGTTTFASWSERDHGIKIRPGLYLQGEAAYLITETLAISGFLRLDTAADFNVGSGSTSYNIDPNGVTTGLMLRIALP